MEDRSLLRFALVSVFSPCSRHTVVTGVLHCYMKKRISF